MYIYTQKKKNFDVHVIIAYRRVDQRLKLQLVEGEIDKYEYADAASHLVKL